MKILLPGAMTHYVCMRLLDPHVANKWHFHMAGLQCRHGARQLDLETIGKMSLPHQRAELLRTRVYACAAGGAIQVG